MNSYSLLLGKRVKAHYRAGNIYLSAMGTLDSVTTKSIFIEEHFLQGGKKNTMRVEIPFEYVKRVSEVPPEPAHAGKVGRSLPENSF